MRKLILTALIALPAAALAADKPATPAAAQKTSVRHLDVKVTASGFEPKDLKLKKGEPTEITFTRVAEGTCITAVVGLTKNKIDLPLNKPVTVTLTPEKTGTIPFSCPMGMGDGKVVVE